MDLYIIDYVINHQLWNYIYQLIFLSLSSRSSIHSNRWSYKVKADKNVQMVYQILVHNLKLLKVQRNMDEDSNILVSIVGSRIYIGECKYYMSET